MKIYCPNEAYVYLYEPYDRTSNSTLLMSEHRNHNYQDLYELDDSRIISETNCGDSLDPGYQPAQDINRLSVRYVIDSLNQRGIDTIPVAQTRELKVLSDTLQAFGAIVEKSSANKLLKDI